MGHAASERRAEASRDGRPQARTRSRTSSIDRATPIIIQINNFKKI
ncbi:MAG: hypothetical protein Q8761_03185 [Sweet potato little leaf phytoplasma]|nr:hypothetical protein [Sweet potato little leaf phytoplasma]